MSPAAPAGRGPIRLIMHQGFQEDLRSLAETAERYPYGPERALLGRAMELVKGIKGGAPSTHPLEYLRGYPDLSDCQTTYVSPDRDSRPSHRIVWREGVSRRDGTVVREVIAIGERDYGAAYHLAGSRLGRPVGYTLDELRAQPEPISAQAQADDAKANTSAARRERVLAERKRAHPELFEPAATASPSQGALER